MWLKVSKYYEIDYLRKFLLLFKFVLTAKLVKNIYILGGIFVIFLKNVLKQTLNSFNTKFHPQRKDRKSSYQVIKTLVIFCHLIALISS